MSNSAFLIAGADAQIDAWWETGEESGATLVAQRGNGTPLLWAAMFEVTDIRPPNPDADPEDAVSYTLRTDPILAAERVIDRQASVSRLLPVSADLGEWAALLSDRLRKINAGRIELDVTELALMIGPKVYLPSLTAFLQCVGQPDRYLGWLASLFRTRRRMLQTARGFVKYECNLESVKQIPTVKAYRLDPQAHGRTVANLIGDIDHAPY